MDHMYQVRKITDITTQKCRIDISTLRQLEVKPASFAVIAMESTEYICQVWPTQHLGTGIEVGTAVKKHTDVKKEKTCKIKPLNVVPGKSVSVSLVVTKAEDVRAYRRMTTESAQNVADICRGLLYKTCISSHFVVDKENCTLAKLHGISLILIDKVSDDNYCVVDNTTYITVKAIQSREHYLQKQATVETIPLGGLDKVSKELCEFIRLSFSEKSTANSILRLPKGVLLRSPPGTGKTSLVRNVCMKCNAFIISVNGPEVFGSRSGETEENIKKVFEKAFLMSEEGPCVVFLDEIDSLCPKRGNSDDTNDTRSTSVFLSYLDKIHDYKNIAVIGATNRPAALDPSLRRPGRLDREVRFEIKNIDLMN